MSVSLEVNDAKSKNKRNTEPVNSEIFKLLKVSYADNFHSSPSKLRAKLDQTFPDEIKRAKDGSGSLISDKTIRNFFSASRCIRRRIRHFGCGAIFCKIKLVVLKHLT